MRQKMSNQRRLRINHGPADYLLIRALSHHHGVTLDEVLQKVGNNLAQLLILCELAKLAPLFSDKIIIYLHLLNLMHLK